MKNNNANKKLVVRRHAYTNGLTKYLILDSDNKVITHLSGDVKPRELDENTFLFIANNNNEKMGCIVSFCDDKYSVYRFTIDEGMAIKYGEVSKSRKHIVLPCGSKYVIYSYGEDKFVTEPFDEIFLTEKGYKIKINVDLDDTQFQLIGHLNGSCKLIGSLLYSDILPQQYPVDPNDINGSTEALKPKLQAELQRYNERRAALDYKSYIYDFDQKMRKRYK